MNTKTTLKNKFEREGCKIFKRSYQKPVLKTYGKVKHLTQSTGSANGDGGHGMMDGMN